MLICFVASATVSAVIMGTVLSHIAGIVSYNSSLDIQTRADPFLVMYSKCRTSHTWNGFLSASGCPETVLYLLDPTIDV